MPLSSLWGSFLLVILNKKYETDYVKGEAKANSITKIIL